MPHPSWMIERLHVETRANHAEADADLDLLFREHTSVADYAMFLARQYGFEAPLEASCAVTPNLDLMIDLRDRQKAELIVNDLRALGYPADAPLCLRVPQFRGAAEALGWMYVIERATLAHCVIRRHLSMRLSKPMREASAYLGAYAGNVGKRWRDFGMVLDDVARHPVIADRIVEAANDAFRTQRRWVAQDLHPGRAAVAV